MRRETSAAKDEGKLSSSPSAAAAEELKPVNLTNFKDLRRLMQTANSQ
jgi:hypothetical protein